MSDTDFDDWNRLKKRLEDLDSPVNRFPQEGEVWFSFMGKNLGQEQNGKGSNFSRPVLVIKKFNNRIFWVVPLSSKQKRLSFYLSFTDPHGNEASAILAQMKLMSIKRFDRKAYVLTPVILSEIKNGIKGML